MLFSKKDFELFFLTQKKKRFWAKKEKNHVRYHLTLINYIHSLLHMVSQFLIGQIPYFYRFFSFSCKYFYQQCLLLNEHRETIEKYSIIICKDQIGHWLKYHWHIFDFFANTWVNCFNWHSRFWRTKLVFVSQFFLSFFIFQLNNCIWFF
jgi:hypothetical protein